MSIHPRMVAPDGEFANGRFDALRGCTVVDEEDGASHADGAATAASVGNDPEGSDRPEE
jgi:hypothetical protein